MARSSASRRSESDENKAFELKDAKVFYIAVAAGVEAAGGGEIAAGDASCFTAP